MTGISGGFYDGTSNTMDMVHEGLAKQAQQANQAVLDSLKKLNEKATTRRCWPTCAIARTSGRTCSRSMRPWVRPSRTPSAASCRSSEHGAFIG